MAAPGRFERRKIIDPVLEDLLGKYYAEMALKVEKAWQEKWSWLIDEYRRLQEKGAEITGKSYLLENVEKVRGEEDNRDLKPIPLTTNGTYGWIATKPDFSLTMYGPDTYIAFTLPEEYVLDKRFE